MASSKWIAFIFILIALIASLEYMPRDLLVRVAIPQDASYPLNEGPYGTSLLWQEFEARGYNTKIIYGLSGLPEASNYTDLVYLAVGGSTSSSKPLEEAYTLLERAVASGVRVHFILMDEDPQPAVILLTRQVSQLVCDAEPPRIHGILNSTITTFYGIAGGREYSVPTGFTGYLTYSGQPIVYPAKPVLPQPLMEYKSIAAAWPYPGDPYRGEWYIVGAECSSSKGSVVIVADSTIAVNLVTRNNNDAIDYILGLISERVASPETTLIVSDEELYVAPGNENVQLVLSFHPSILLLAASQLYVKAEAFVREAFSLKGLTPLLIAAIASILASASVYPVFPPKSRIRRQRAIKLPEYSSIIASWESVSSLCDFASSYLGLSLSMGESRMREELSHLEEIIRGTCSRVERAGSLRRLIPLWGATRKKLERSLVEYLSLSGLYDYEEALRLVKGGMDGRRG